jgi:hypothetical protein
MERELIISTLVTVLFSVLKFIEMKYIDKESRPMKLFVRDSILVFICTFVCCYVFFTFDVYITDFFNVVTDSKIINPANTQVFTDVPGF